MEYTLPTYWSELTERNRQKAIQGLDKNTAMYLPSEKNIFLSSDKKG